MKLFGIIALLLSLTSYTAATHSGFVDIDFLDGDLQNLQANAYMVICLIDTGFSPRLPIADYPRTCTQSCTSDVAYHTSHPFWRGSCRGNSIHPSSMRVVVEIHHTTGPGARNKTFLGGNSVTVDELLQSGLNGHAWRFRLFDGTAHGWARVRVHWTKRT